MTQKQKAVSIEPNLLSCGIWGPRIGKIGHEFGSSRETRTKIVLHEKGRNQGLGLLLEMRGCSQTPGYEQWPKQNNLLPSEENSLVKLEHEKVERCCQLEKGN